MNASAPQLLIAQGAVALDVPLDAEQVGRLEQLVEHLLRWNRRINLIGRCDVEVAIDRHIHDGLGLLRLLDREDVRAHGRRWVDVGSGAGLPGLVLAVARPNLAFTLVEPIGKKAAFTLDAVHRLGLTNVEVRQTRLEALEARQASAAMSRATFAPDEWLALGREFVMPGGLVLVTMGGAGVPAVLDDAWHIDQFQLPLSRARRTNIIAIA